MSARSRVFGQFGFFWWVWAAVLFMLVAVMRRPATTFGALALAALVWWLTA